MLLIKKQYLPVMTCIICSIIYAVIFYFFVKEGKKNMLNMGNKVFKESIGEDRSKRLGEVNPFFQYTFFSKPVDSIVTIEYEDKKMVIDLKNSPRKKKEYNSVEEGEHLYLLFLNPVKVLQLDSLFRKNLKKEGIYVKTAVAYSAYDTTQYSYPDNIFYMHAQKLEEFEAGPTGEIKINGYMKIPFSSIWRKDIFTFSFIFVAWLASLFGLWYWNKSSRHKWIPVKESLPSPRLLSEITPSLFLDRDSGYLFHKRKKLALPETSLQLFLYLLDGENHYRSNEDIKEHLWNNRDISQNTLLKTVSRLRKYLSPVKDISLEIIPRKGCRLILKR